MRKKSRLVLVVLLVSLMMLSSLPVLAAVPTPGAGISESVIGPIQTPLLTYGVQAPAGGAKLYGGDSYTIKWRFNVDTSSFGFTELYLSEDAGATWSIIEGTETLSNSTTSYKWTVPKVNTTKAKIKVVAVKIKMVQISPGQFKPVRNTEELVSGTFTINSIVQLIPVIPIVPIALPPAAPSGLTASTVSSSEIDLAWTDNATDEDGFVVERKQDGAAAFAVIANLAANVKTYKDNSLTASTKYFYRVKAKNTHGSSAYTSEVNATTLDSISSIIPLDPGEHLPLPGETPAAPSGTIVMKYYIGSGEYYVDGVVQSMDASPVVLGGRTMLPIRYVATPLGATVDWNAVEKSVTVAMGSNTIQVWIGSNTAMVNGIQVPVDPDNSSVMPIVVPPGRTMLPLRFIAENLGCKVDWNPTTKEVKVTYPAAV